MMRIGVLLLLLAGSLGLPASALATALLTDITVFSSNSAGENWNSLIWNTQGADTDLPAPGRFNLYVTSDPLTEPNPMFLNGFNDARTRVSLPVTPGTRTYSIYGEGVGITFDPRQHFVMNLYFDGNEGIPDISGVQNLDGTALAPAGHPNGLDIFGNSGQQEAGTLSAIVAGHMVTLTAFDWITDGQRNVVWDYWANDAPFGDGSPRLDYYGAFTLTVDAIEAPAPATLALLAAGLLGIGRRRLRRRADRDGAAVPRRPARAAVLQPRRRARPALVRWHADRSA
jgi:hypothetical protein